MDPSMPQQQPNNGVVPPYPQAPAPQGAQNGYAGPMQPGQYGPAPAAMPQQPQYAPAPSQQQQQAPQPQYAAPQPQQQAPQQQYYQQPAPQAPPGVMSQSMGGGVVSSPMQAGVPGQPGVKPVQQHANPNSTQNMLQIAEIRDGIVIMSDGSFRSVIMVKSINFDLMSPQEQESVEYAYQGFLNSLYFPIQIFIRSQRVDLQPYIEKLDKIRSEHDNMLLALLMEDYISYIDQLSLQTNIMDKKFYIVVPYFPTTDVQKALSQSKNFITGVTALFNSKEQHVVINEADLEKAKTELRNRVQSVLSGLMQCTIQGLPLDTQELIELYYDTYNPDTATRQQLKNFNELNADIITKGAGKALQPHLQRELQ